MYLDTHDIEETEQALLQYYITIGKYERNCSEWMCAVFSQLGWFLFAIGIVLFFFAFQKWWLYFVPITGWFILMWAGHSIARRELKKTPSFADIKNYIATIKEAPTNIDDRELFFHLLLALREKRWDDAQEIVEELLISDALAAVPVMHDLRSGLKRLKASLHTSSHLS